MFPQLRLTAHEQGITAILLVAYLLAGLIHPAIALIPTTVATCLLICSSILKPISKLRSPYRIAALSMFVVMGSLAVAIPAHAIEFSFLLSATEETLTTCITNQISGLSVFPGLVFGAFRVAVMFGVGWQGWQAIEDRKKHQDNTDHIKLIVGTAVLLVLVGVFEPLIVQPC